MNYSMTSTTRRAATVGAAILESGDFRVFNLDNGGVRLIMVGFTGFDIPAGHAKFADVAALTAANVEDYYDECYGAYCCA